MEMSSLTAILFLFHTNIFCLCRAKEDIYIAGFLPENHEGSLQTKNIYDSVNFALENINNSTHILANYNLKILWNDTQVEFDFIG